MARPPFGHFLKNSKSATYLKAWFHTGHYIRIKIRGNLNGKKQESEEARNTADYKFVRTFYIFIIRHHIHRKAVCGSKC